MIPGDPCGSCLFCWGHCSVTVVVIVKGPATNAIDDGCCSYRCRVPKTVYNTEEERERKINMWPVLFSSTCSYLVL